ASRRATGRPGYRSLRHIATRAARAARDGLYVADRRADALDSLGADGAPLGEVRDLFHGRRRRDPRARGVSSRSQRAATHSRSLTHPRQWLRTATESFSPMPAQNERWTTTATPKRRTVAGPWPTSVVRKAPPEEPTPPTPPTFYPST